MIHYIAIFRDDFSNFVNRANRSNSSNSGISIQSEVSSLFRKQSSNVQASIPSTLRDQRENLQETTLVKNPFQSSSIQFTSSNFPMNIDQLSDIPQKMIVAKFDARSRQKDFVKDDRIFPAIMKGTITKGNVIPRLSDF